MPILDVLFVGIVIVLVVVGALWIAGAVRVLRNPLQAYWWFKSSPRNDEGVE